MIHADPLETRQLRRMRAEDKLLGKLERLERKAEKMVGHLSSGKFYCYPVGGTYFEAMTEGAVIDFLIRNKYVL